MIFQWCHGVNAIIGTEEEIFEPESQTVFSSEFLFYLFWEEVTHGKHSDVCLCDYILSFKEQSTLKAMVFLDKATGAYKTKAMIENNKQRWTKHLRPQATDTMMRLGFDKSRHSKFRINYRESDHTQWEILQIWTCRLWERALLVITWQI